MELAIRLNKTPNKVTFPQANSIYIMIKTLDNITGNYKKDILKNIDYNITPRQIGYYLSALEYLKLVRNKKPTKLGYFVMDFPIDQIYTSFVKLILEEPLFYDFYINKDSDKTINQLTEHYNYSLSTMNRRLSTVKKWIDWCGIIISDYKLNIKVITI